MEEVRVCYEFNGGKVVLELLGDVVGDVLILNRLWVGGRNV